ncbi:DUF6452 family protein [Flavobacterium psychrotolerans]|uniref:Lipoprotein n=1 Tax=Flavobacterium psychrotolerans TaxID=2169410 RepID=A0A2U1JJ72_9FLAO|nr:DUF6452 family protein [Flavobacterium psychrotolerans]PWA05054.1 hypothetical protein DB895_08460 [Flavobacterium psychrotolerans]
MKKILLLIFVLTLSFSSCEKDDICDANTPTTPRLIIDFYDITNPTITKNVTNLGIVGDGLTTGILFNGVHQIQVPLKLTDDKTKFSFVLNAGNTNPALIYTDILEFNYSRKTVFVSRACGYKTLFDLNNDAALPNPFVLNNNPLATQGIWIQNITVEKYNLETENETHIKIYF